MSQQTLRPHDSESIREMQEISETARSEKKWQTPYPAAGRDLKAAAV
jgi:hypothetical protein